MSSEPHTQIHVRNLQTQLPLSTDAWGRPSKSQPILISISVALKKPFSSAADTDEVEGSTVHYGVLSKSILSFCDAIRGDATILEKHHDEKGGSGSSTSLVRFLRALNESLIFTSKDGGKPLLNLNELEFLKTSVVLPKASLLGEGVRFTTTLKGQIFDGGLISGYEIQTKHVLSLMRLSVPCLIGVNDIERTAKQLVIATVNIEPEDGTDERYTEEFVKLESVVVKAISESSFKTLESLTSYLTAQIVREFMSKVVPANERKAPGQTYPRLRLLLEKPTAVTFADAPAVEVLVSTDPKSSKEMAELWKGV